MEVKAVAKYVKVQPRKVRIIADEVRGMPTSRSDALLRFHPSKSAKMLRKVLVSAVANAKENHGLSPDSLRIAAITVDEGPRMKRMRARAQGRGYRILKKTSHITVVVEEMEPTPRSKATATKAKPRPTFAAPKKGGAKKKAAAAQAEETQPETTDTAVEEIEVAPVGENEGATIEAEESTTTAAPAEHAEEPAADVETEAPAEAAGETAEANEGSDKKGAE